MKRTAILSGLATLVLAALACSTVDLQRLIPAVATQPVGDTATPFATWTNTVAAAPTWTLTPTLIGLRPSETPTTVPTATNTFAPGTITIIPTVIGPSISATPLPVSTGFEYVLLSTPLIYIGNCGDTEVEFTAQVTKPDKIESVVLFTRLRDKLTSGETNWDRGTAMESEGEGKYTVTLSASHFTQYANAWLLYQLVGTDDENQIRARTPVFAENLSVAKCSNVTLTPATSTPTP